MHRELTRNNIVDAGFDLDDEARLLDLLDSSEDEPTFRRAICDMEFTGDYPGVYDSDLPYYKALSCIA